MAKTVQVKTDGCIIQYTYAWQYNSQSSRELNCLDLNGNMQFINFNSYKTSLAYTHSSSGFISNFVGIFYYRCYFDCLHYFQNQLLTCQLVHIQQKAIVADQANYTNGLNQFDALSIIYSSKNSSHLFK